MDSKNITKCAELLYQQAINARNYLDILARISELSQNYIDEMLLAGKFFVEVSRALDKALILELAKIFDSNSKNNIQNLLNCCLKSINSFNCLEIHTTQNNSFSYKSLTNCDYLKRFMFLKNIEAKTIYRINFPDIKKYHTFLRTLKFYFHNDEIDFWDTNSNCCSFHKSIPEKISESNHIMIEILCDPKEQFEEFENHFNCMKRIGCKIKDLKNQRDKIYIHNDKEALSQNIDNVQSMLNQYSLQNKDNLYVLINFAVDFTSYIIQNLKGENPSETENRHPDIGDLEILLETVSQNAKLLPEL